MAVLHTKKIFFIALALPISQTDIDFLMQTIKNHNSRSVLGQSVLIIFFISLFFFNAFHFFTFTFLIFPFFVKYNTNTILKSKYFIKDRIFCRYSNIYILFLGSFVLISLIVIINVFKATSRYKKKSKLF